MGFLARWPVRARARCGRVLSCRCSRRVGKSSRSQFLSFVVFASGVGCARARAVGGRSFFYHACARLFFLRLHMSFLFTHVCVCSLQLGSLLPCALQSALPSACAEALSLPGQTTMGALHLLCQRLLREFLEAVLGKANGVHPLLFALAGLVVRSVCSLRSCCWC